MESCLFAYSFDDGRWVILDPEFRLSRLKEGLENKTIEYANDSDVLDMNIPLWSIDNSQITYE